MEKRPIEEKHEGGYVEYPSKDLSLGGYKHGPANNPKEK
jgi:hypothetical protein